MPAQAAVCLGNFNAEEQWKPHNRCTLPRFTSEQGSNIVSALDELLFPLCHSDQDILITKHKTDEGLITYLHSLGFAFQYVSLQTFAHSAHDRPDLARTIMTNRSHFSTLFNSRASFRPYAVDRDCIDIYNAFTFTNHLPRFDAVQKVNSKSFSLHLREQLATPFGRLCRSADDFREGARLMVETGPIVVKDEYGVSGNGNLLLDNENRIDRIARYIQTQEREGKDITLVIEPFLTSLVDFSSHLIITDEGDVTIASVQIMHNKGFSFRRISAAGDEFRHALEGTPYFDTVIDVAKALYREGYVGWVCVDSMLSKEHGIIPIVEVNARHSMGLINSLLDRHLEKTGSLMFYNLRTGRDFRFDEFFHSLRTSGFLFGVNSNAGIVPLTSSAMEVNGRCNPDEPVTDGRFYFYLVAADASCEREILAGLHEVLSRLQVKIC